MDRDYRKAISTNKDILTAVEFVFQNSGLKYNEKFVKEGMYELKTETANLLSIESILNKLNEQIRLVARQRDMAVIQEGPTEARKFISFGQRIHFEYQTYYELWPERYEEFYKVTIVINRCAADGISGKLLKYKYLEVTLEVV